MSILSLENVAKNFGVKALFENATFSVEEKDKIRTAQQVWYKQNCSVYNVHVSNKRGQEAMKVGNDFGSTLLSQTRRTVWSVFRLHPYYELGLLIPNRSVERHRTFLVLAFSSEDKPDTSLNCQSDSGRWLGGVFLVDDWLCIGSYCGRERETAVFIKISFYLIFTASIFPRAS